SCYFCLDIIFYFIFLTTDSSNHIPSFHIIFRHNTNYPLRRLKKPAIALANTVSTPHVANEKIIVNTATMIVYLCTSAQGVHDTFDFNSLNESDISLVNLAMALQNLHGWRDSNPHQQFWRPLFYP